ncbi:precorrin-2 dehydrogenase/sirohydrochlorin ferrochelatase family protein [Paenibacillus sp. Marseille-Q7038]
MENHYVPVMLNCSGRRCIIIGGGKVAERKMEALAGSGALLTIISPEVTKNLLHMVHRGEAEWRKKPYLQGDLEGAFLVYAATDSPEVNEQVIAEAQQRNILVNRADAPSTGDFITPSSVRRGKLTIAVSASGASPGLSKRIMEQMRADYGEEYEIYLDFLQQFREVIQLEVEDRRDRKCLLDRVLEMDILAQIRKKQFRPWSQEEMVRWLNANREG